MKKRINLALQGGGAHGAFTWGVLDRLLEDEGIEIAAMSGTSAGALNAAAVKAGLVEGTSETARENLDWLWSQVAAIDDESFNHWMGGLSPATLSRLVEYSIPFNLFDAASRVVSPYDIGPGWHNPLRPIVERFHYDAVCNDTGPALHICATNVRTGKVRVFSGSEIRADPILASACLPTLFRAVEIADPVSGRIEAYWDGGYTGNPALFPLFDASLPDDILIININPLIREETPRSVREIQNRINEISFNSSLLRELRAIAFVQRLLAEGTINDGAMKKVLVHMIADDELMTQLSVATKTFALRSVINSLKAAGQAAADRFLSEHRQDLNDRSTVDLAAMFD